MMFILAYEMQITFGHVLFNLHVCQFRLTGQRVCMYRLRLRNFPETERTDEYIGECLRSTTIEHFFLQCRPTDTLKHMHRDDVIHLN